MLTGVQTPFLGTPLIPLRVNITASFWAPRLPHPGGAWAAYYYHHHYYYYYYYYYYYTYISLSLYIYIYIYICICINNIRIGIGIYIYIYTSTHSIYVYCMLHVSGHLVSSCPRGARVAGAPLSLEYAQSPYVLRLSLLRLLASNFPRNSLWV